jgi:hypothetical protein
MSTLYEQISAWCIHYQGRHGNTACKAGIEFSTFGESIKEMPCIKRNGHPIGVCPLREFPSHEEVQKEVDLIEAHARELKQLAPLMTQMRIRFKGMSGQDTFKCPTCADGKLTISIAGCNGHTRGICTTAGCHNWIE